MMRQLLKPIWICLTTCDFTEPKAIEEWITQRTYTSDNQQCEFIELDINSRSINKLN